MIPVQILNFRIYDFHLRKDLQNTDWGELSAKIIERDRNSSDKNATTEKSKTNNEVAKTAKEKLDQKSMNWDELGAQLDQLEGAATMDVDKSVEKEVTQNIADGQISQVDSNIIIAKKETKLKNNATDEKLNEKSNFNENISKMGFQIDIW